MKIKSYLPLAIIVGSLGFSVNAFAVDDITVDQSNTASPQVSSLDQSGIVSAPISHIGFARGNEIPLLDASPGFLNFLDNGGTAEQENLEMSNQTTGHFLYSSVVQDVSTMQESIGNSTSITAPNRVLTMGTVGGLAYNQLNEDSTQSSSLAIGLDRIGGIMVFGVVAQTIPVADVTAKGNQFFSNSLSYAGDVDQSNKDSSDQFATIEMDSVVLTQPGTLAPSATTVGNEAITFFQFTVFDDNRLSQSNVETERRSAIDVKNSAAPFVLDHDADANATGNLAISGTHVLSMGEIKQSNGTANTDPITVAGVGYENIVTAGGFTIDANAIGNDLFTDQAALSDVDWEQTNVGDMAALGTTGEIARVLLLNVVNGPNGHVTNANAIGNRTASLVDFGFADITIKQTNTQVPQQVLEIYTNVVSGGTISATSNAIGNTYTVNP